MKRNNVLDSENKGPSRLLQGRGILDLPFLQMTIESIGITPGVMILLLLRNMLFRNNSWWRALSIYSLGSHNSCFIVKGHPKNSTSSKSAAVGGESGPDLPSPE